MISQEEKDKKYMKTVKGMFLEFFRDSTLHFKDRVDDGNITIKELNDYIHEWVETHLG